MVVHYSLRWHSLGQRQLPSANTYLYLLTIEGAHRLASWLPAMGAKANSYSLQHVA